MALGRVDLLDCNDFWVNSLLGIHVGFKKTWANIIYVEMLEHNASKTTKIYITCLGKGSGVKKDCKWMPILLPLLTVTNPGKLFNGLSWTLIETVRVTPGFSQHTSSSTSRHVIVFVCVFSRVV